MLLKKTHITEKPVWNITYGRIAIFILSLNISVYSTKWVYTILQNKPVLINYKQCNKHNKNNMLDQVKQLTFTNIQTDSSKKEQAVVKVIPVDEGNNNQSFKEFRNKLIEATNNKDKNFILSIITSDIQNNFGGDGGIKEFKEIWQIDNKDSRLWDELRVILKLGGRFSKDNKNEFWAPYLFTDFPADGYDCFDYSAIITNHLNLREKPDIHSKSVTKLNYDIVKVDLDHSVLNKSKDEILWAKINTLDGKEGYVLGKYVRSPIGYRAGFIKKKGKWLMNTLIDGDD